MAQEGGTKCQPLSDISGGEGSERGAGSGGDCRKFNFRKTRTTNRDTVTGNNCGNNEQPLKPQCSAPLSSLTPESSLATVAPFACTRSVHLPSPSPAPFWLWC